MKQALTSYNDEPYVLKLDWQSYLRRQPLARIHHVAAALQVSEAELVAANCGLKAIRLSPDWPQMVSDLQSFGKVSAITRNPCVTYRQTGYYQNIQCMGDSAIVHGRELELGFNFAHWHSAFAVEEQNVNGRHQSLRFFDGNGNSIHEISMIEQSCLSAYRAFIRNYKAPDKFAAPLISPSLSSVPSSNNPVTGEKLQNGWKACKKLQDFPELFKQYGLTRYQALQLLAESHFAVSINPAVFSEFIHTLVEMALPVMIYVRNQGAVQIYNGSLEKVKVSGANLSLLNYGAELHFDMSRIDSLWVVKKTIESRMLSSLELYDAQRQPIALIYGRHDAETREDRRWRELTDSLSFSHQ